MTCVDLLHLAKGNVAVHGIRLHARTLTVLPVITGACTYSSASGRQGRHTWRASCSQDDQTSRSASESRLQECYSGARARSFTRTLSRSLPLSFARSLSLSRSLSLALALLPLGMPGIIRYTRSHSLARSLALARAQCRLCLPVYPSARYLPRVYVLVRRECTSAAVAGEVHTGNPDP